MRADAGPRVFMSRIGALTRIKPPEFDLQPLPVLCLPMRDERPGMRLDEPAVLFGEWPLTLSRKRVGERIRQLTDSGRVRHDLLVDKSRVGRIIGQRGSTLQALLQVRLC